MLCWKIKYNDDDDDDVEAKTTTYLGNCGTEFGVLKLSTSSISHTDINTSFSVA